MKGPTYSEILQNLPIKLANLTFFPNECPYLCEHILGHQGKNTVKKPAQILKYTYGAFELGIKV